MGLPNSLTQQLQEKYTHELYVYERGKAKYDIIDWQQNYSGWVPRQNKEWIQCFDFPEVPLDVYKEYDLNRVALVDELNQQIKDSVYDNEVTKLLKRIDDKDIEILEEIQAKGPLTPYWIEQHDGHRDALKKCKSRSPVFSVRKGSHYQYYISDFGIMVLDTIQTQKIDSVKSLQDRIFRQK